MEWNEKDQKLKGKRRKKIPLRVPSNVDYNFLRKEAEEKWKNFHSDLHDESQIYHLLYEDGQHAVYIPGSNKEPFTLGRYHEELGKDYKRITLFLCSDIDFLQAEGLLDDEIEFETKLTKRPIGNEDPSQNNPAKRPRCDGSIDHTTTNACSNDQSGKPNQMKLDQELANQLQELYDNEENACSPVALSKTNCESLPSTTDIVKSLAAKVDTSDQQLFIVVRRNAQLNRLLLIWQREIKKKPSCYMVRLKFTGEQGIDTGALAREFFTLTPPNIGSVMFPDGKPVDSMHYVQNGNFRACGEIVAASLAQGGPAPSFLDASVFDLMVSTSLSLQELDPEIHLTASNRVLLDSVRKDVMANSDTIVEHNYTGRIDDEHIDDILQSIVVSIVTKRLVYLNEFMEGLDSYGLKNILHTCPDVCKALFVYVHEGAVDANYLFSILHPEYAAAGSTRKEIEESLMDFFQDFLFSLEDNSNFSCYAEAETQASRWDTAHDSSKI